MKDTEEGSEPQEWFDALANTNSRLMAHLFMNDSNQMEFKIDRPENDDPKLTFSSDSLEALSQQICFFLGTRAMKEWQRTGKAPKHMSAIVDVEFE